MWLSLRQPYADFWGLTVKEVTLIVDGLMRAEERQVDTQRALNHEMAGLIAYAHHDPAKMPKFEGRAKTGTGSRQREIEEMRFRSALKAMAGQS